MYYHQKLVISGSFLELYKYEKIQKRGFTRKKKRKPNDEQLKTDDVVEEETEREKAVKHFFKRRDSVARTRSQIKRMINSNPDLSKFYTLTFKENILDVKKANKYFTKFMMKMNYHYGVFKYISVIEFQTKRGKKNHDDGAVHYHFLCNLPFLKAKKIRKLWGHGRIKIQQVDGITNLGAYVCKYLQKEMTDERLFNKKKYFCSKNMERPTHLHDDKIIDELVLLYGLDVLKVDFEKTFKNKYTGNVIYKQFNIKNNAT